MDTRTEFEKVYGEELTNAIRENPGKYSFGVDRVPQIVKAVITSLLYESGTVSIDTPVFRSTCARLKIPHTSAAIMEKLVMTGITEVRGLKGAVWILKDGDHFRVSTLDPEDINKPYTTTYMTEEKLTELELAIHKLRKGH